MKHSKSAAILPTAMVMLAITASVVAMSVAITGHHSRQARRVTNRNTAIGYGDGVIENLFDQWRQSMSSVTNATDRTDGLTTRSLSTRSRSADRRNAAAAGWNQPRFVEHLCGGSIPATAARH